MTRMIRERQFSFCLSLRNGIRNLTNEGAIPPDDTIEHEAIIKREKYFRQYDMCFIFLYDVFQKYCVITYT